MVKKSEMTNELESKMTNELESKMTNELESEMTNEFKIVSPQIKGCVYYQKPVSIIYNKGIKINSVGVHVESKTEEILLLDVYFEIKTKDSSHPYVTQINYGHYTPWGIDKKKFYRLISMVGANYLGKDYVKFNNSFRSEYESFKNVKPELSEKLEVILSKIDNPYQTVKLMDED